MEGADALGLIAEVGIAIAGFAGVVAALRAPGGRLTPYEALRISSLLGLSGTAVLLALVPGALQFAGLMETRIWTSSSLAMIVFLATMTFAQFRYYRIAFEGRPVGTEARAPGGRIVSTSFNVLRGAIVALQLANVIVMGQLWPFYFGLLAITAMSLFQFGNVLFTSPSPEVRT